MGSGGQGYRSKKSDCTARHAQDDTVDKLLHLFRVGGQERGGERGIQWKFEGRGDMSEKSDCT